MILEQPRIAFIGIGNVGHTLAYLLHEVNFSITALYNRTPKNAESLVERINVPIVESLKEVVILADVIFLTVADDAISQIVSQIKSESLNNKTFLHVSGANSLDILYPLKEQGADIASFHPALPFANVENAIAYIQKNPIAIATESENKQTQALLSQLVHAFNAKEIRIPANAKAQYHLALVFASNYAVTLYSIATELLKPFASDSSTTSIALNPLVNATIQNIMEVGIPDALTGPLSRRDARTIGKHLNALESKPEIDAVYRLLALQTLPLVSGDVTELSRLLSEIKD